MPQQSTLSCGESKGQRGGPDSLQLVKGLRAPAVKMVHSSDKGVPPLIPGTLVAPRWCHPRLPGPEAMGPQTDNTLQRHLGSNEPCRHDRQTTAMNPGVAQSMINRLARSPLSQRVPAGKRQERGRGGCQPEKLNAKKNDLPKVKNGICPPIV